MAVAIFVPSIMALSAHLSSIRRKHLDLSKRHLFVQCVHLIYAVDIALTTILGALYHRHLGHNELKWIYGQAWKLGQNGNKISGSPSLFCTIVITVEVTVHLAGDKIDSEEQEIYSVFLLQSCKPVQHFPRGIIYGVESNQNNEIHFRDRTKDSLHS